ncbi:MAG: hypothetical protein LBH32_06365, partial [Dysgonamonadaceae bacterium]|nr:hypothetical protein [Dysgonamonadaceae bacterium]
IKVSQLRCSVYIPYIFTVRLRTRLQRYWRYAPSRKTQGFAEDSLSCFRATVSPFKKRSCPETIQNNPPFKKQSYEVCMYAQNKTYVNIASVNSKS